MLLTESKLTEVLTEGLRYHLETKTPLYENVFRPGSEEYFNTIRQARTLLNKGVLTELCLEDMELLFETEVGEYGMYNGKKVPLDFPMLNEISMVIPSPATSWREASQEPLVMKMGEERWMDLAGKAKAAGGLGYQTKYSDIKSFLGELPQGTITFSDTDQVQMPTALKYMNGNQVSYKLTAGADILASILPEDPDPDMWVVDITGEAQETPLQEILSMIDEAGLKDFEKQALIMKIKKAAQGSASSKHLEQIIDDLVKKLEKPSATGVKYAYGKRVEEATFDSPAHIAIYSGPEGDVDVYKTANGGFYFDTGDYDGEAPNAEEAAKWLKRNGFTTLQAGKLDEAKYKGKEVKLNKPMRSTGPKKYKVYTKNAKGNVVVVNFGDAKGGLTAKINNAKARKAFSDRHNCPTKKDKTKAGYWSCRLPRYASLLGLKSSFGGYW